jgi:hypothetical protein
MSLRNIIAFGGKKIDVIVKRKGEKLNVVVVSGNYRKEITTTNGSTVTISL